VTHDGTVYIVRDAQNTVKHTVLHHAQAVRLCKGRKGWSFEPIPDALTQQAVDALNSAGGFYVTAIRDGKQVAYLFGPVADHDVAISLVPFFRSIACRVDPYCAFDAFGTAKLTGDNPPGKLNNYDFNNC
jgi:hypothetical protein